MEDFSDLALFNLGQEVSPFDLMEDLGPNASAEQMLDLNNVAYTQMLEGGNLLFPGQQGPALWNEDGTLGIQQGPDIWKDNNSYIPKVTYLPTNNVSDIYDIRSNSDIKFAPKNSKNAYGVFEGPQNKTGIDAANIMDKSVIPFNNATGMGHGTVFMGQPTTFSMYPDFAQKFKGSNRVKGPFGNMAIGHTNTLGNIDIPKGAGAAAVTTQFKSSPWWGSHNQITYSPDSINRVNKWNNGSANLVGDGGMSELSNTVSHERTHILDNMMPRSSKYGYVRNRGNIQNDYSYGHRDGNQDKPFTGGTGADGKAFMSEWGSPEVKGPDSDPSRMSRYNHYYNKLNEAPRNQYMRPELREATSKAYASLYNDKRNFNATKNYAQQIVNKHGMANEDSINYSFSPNEQGARAVAEYVRLKNLGVTDRDNSWDKSIISENVYDNFENMFNVMNKGPNSFY